MKYFIYLFPLIIIFGLVSLYADVVIPRLLAYRNATLEPTIQQTTQLNTSKFLSITPSPSPKLLKRTVQVPVDSDTREWGVAKEIEKGTYTIRVGNDAAMGSPQEVFAALNAYRNTNGKSTLQWDDTLAHYAQSRAEYMHGLQTTDQHAGFNHYLENDDGFNRLGFYQLGENSYYGGPLTGTHVIEWVFAKSPGHDANQKSSDWSHVGIGTTDSTVNLIFGGSKM